MADSRQKHIEKDKPTPARSREDFIQQRVNVSYTHISDMLKQNNLNDTYAIWSAESDLKNFILESITSAPSASFNMTNYVITMAMLFESFLSNNIQSGTLLTRHLVANIFSSLQPIKIDDQFFNLIGSHIKYNLISTRASTLIEANNILDRMFNHYAENLGDGLDKGIFFDLLNSIKSEFTFYVSTNFSSEGAITPIVKDGRRYKQYSNSNHLEKYWELINRMIVQLNEFLFLFVQFLNLLSLIPNVESSKKEVSDFPYKRSRDELVMSLYHRINLNAFGKLPQDENIES